MTHLLHELLNLKLVLEFFPFPSPKYHKYCQEITKIITGTTTDDLTPPLSFAFFLAFSRRSISDFSSSFFLRSSELEDRFFSFFFFESFELDLNIILGFELGH